MGIVPDQLIANAGDVRFDSRPIAEQPDLVVVVEVEPRLGEPEAREVELLAEAFGRLRLAEAKVLPCQRRVPVGQRDFEPNPPCREIESPHGIDDHPEPERLPIRCSPDPTIHHEQDPDPITPQPRRFADRP